MGLCGYMSQRYLGSGRFAHAEEAFVKAKTSSGFLLLCEMMFSAARRMRVCAGGLKLGIIENQSSKLILNEANAFLLESSRQILLQTHTYIQLSTASFLKLQA